MALLRAESEREEHGLPQAPSSVNSPWQRVGILFGDRGYTQKTVRASVLKRSILLIDRANRKTDLIKRYALGGTSNLERKRDRLEETDQDKERPSPKRRQTSPTPGDIEPIPHWIRSGRWPRALFEPDDDDMYTLTRKRSTPSVSNPSESNSVSILDGKNPAVKSRRYATLLDKAGIQMGLLEVPPTNSTETLCETLLETDQPTPQDSIFRDDRFLAACNNLQNRNEARVIQDIARLLVPSPETLVLYGSTHLKHLIETADDGWYKSIPLVNGPRPRPDFAVGMRRTAFTATQQSKLSPHIGGWQTSSRIVATDDMYFPFLTCEVKCGNEGLDIADRENAHGASVAAMGVVELYRAVGRQEALHREILAFSVSHDHRNVRIYGHCALIKDKETSFYRHLVHAFDITARNGRDKWTAYKFTRNLYDTFVPIHVNRVCAAVDQLPDPDAFHVQPLPPQSDGGSVPQQQSSSELGLPSPQTTEPVFKKPKGKGVTRQ
ncbi:MAG: hypothetical protein M1832_004403 [Thelocarpon impressellum]|nr:MAG: hypothetical protein M1832_004403 [Thelocarpon impressellum]